ncbi:MAG: FtsQ-type POTRA domain-containing protein [Deltaproteobacteria bacterium]|nr:FtsQ-type POTRA domain-containing protein [Deltaproteobacteria bacterium]
MGAFIQRLQMVTGVLVVLAASVLVAWGLRRYLHQSPRFSVANVVVEGTRRLSSQRVARAAGLSAGRNIFEVDERSAEAKLLANDPWVESVKIRKELPDKVHVRIVERDPRLAANIDGKLMLVDGKGNPFKEAEAGDPMDFPIVTGLRAEQLQKDREGVLGRIRTALELLGDLDDEKVSERFPIQEVHLDEVGGVTVVAGVEALSLVFGEPPYRTKVQKAARVFGELRARQAKAEVVFLDNRAHPERVVVRMRNERASARGAEKKGEKP